MASLVALAGSCPAGAGWRGSRAQAPRSSPPRARAPRMHREDYELLIEAIYEGYLLHYGSPARRAHIRSGSRSARGRPAVCARAGPPGRARRHAAVAELADTITLSALAQGAGEPELADAVWTAGARAVGWGSSEAHRRAKDLALAGAPEAIEAMRTSAARPRRVALNRASILFAAVPDKHTQHKSKYTADRMIPGAFEGETVTRRRFMTVSSQTAGGIAAASFRCPRSALRSDRSSNSRRTSGRTSAPPKTSPTTTTYRSSSRSPRESARPASRRRTCASSTALIDTDPYDRNTPYIAISTRCAHLGCPVRWVDAAERFICPCHGGVYDLLGRRVGGPPVRPLDRFPTRVKGDRVEL